MHELFGMFLFCAGSSADDNTAVTAVEQEKLDFIVAPSLLGAKSHPASAAMWQESCRAMFSLRRDSKQHWRIQKIKKKWVKVRSYDSTATCQREEG